MKNYLGLLGLARTANPTEIVASLELATQKGENIKPLHNAEKILTNELTCTHYMQTHVQYEAICAALSCLDTPEAQDSHRWKERLVEFEPADSDLLP